jgi:hypothetical protein
MKIIEEHVSPEGLLKFLVVDDNGTICLGFDGYPWHTHPDLLAVTYGVSEEDAIHKFIDSLLNGEVTIVISKTNGVIKDIWITDNKDEELKYKSKDETLEFRTWTGK